MATITVETIEKLNIASVLTGLEQHRKAEAALNSIIQTTNASKKEATKVIGAQARALQKEGDEIEAITAKWEAARAAERGYETALQGVGGAAKSASSGLAGLSFQLNDVITGLASGQKPMQVFTQQGGQIFQAFQQTPGLFAALKAGISGAAEVGSSLLLPFLSVGVPLWYDYAAAQEQATAAAESWNETQEAAEPLYDQALEDVRALKKLTEGSLTLEEAKAKIAERYNEQLAAANAPLRERIDLLAKEWYGMAKTDSRYGQTVQGLKDLHAQIRENNRAAAEGAIASATVAEYNYAEAESDRKLAEDKKAAAEARKANTRAAKEEAEALKELLFIMGTEEEIQKLNARLAENDAKILEDNAAGVAKYTARLEAAGDRREAAILGDIAVTKEWEQKQKEAFLSVAKFADSAVGSTAAIYEDLYERKAALAEDGTKQQKEDALKAWRIQHRLALAEAGINLVLASSAALATPPAPNVFAAAAAAALGAVPVANIAAQQAPTFSDTPSGGYRFGAGAGNTIHGAQNDTAILFREPLEGVRQALNVLASRQAPTTTPATGRRSLVGPSLARDPVTRMLTQDVGRVTRGWIMPRSF